MKRILASRNASENPAGIETVPRLFAVVRICCRNASENPAGIETLLGDLFSVSDAVATHQKTQQGLKLGS